MTFVKSKIFDKRDIQGKYIFQFKSTDEKDVKEQDKIIATHLLCQSKENTNTDHSIEFDETYYILVYNKILRLDENSVLDGELMLNNARIKKTSIKNEELRLAGFELMSQGQTLKFYSKDEEVIE